MGVHGLGWVILQALELLQSLWVQQEMSLKHWQFLHMYLRKDPEAAQSVGVPMTKLKVRG